MKNILLEYIWLDGYETANLRSKVKVVKTNIDNYSVENCPVWNFDGSSTLQAEGHSSECLLQPVRIYKWEKDSKHLRHMA